ncbi:MAG: hypothetical protein ACYC1C_09780 [Chloroflexota bacterium]
MSQWYRTKPAKRLELRPLFLVVGLLLALLASGCQLSAGQVGLPGAGSAQNAQAAAATPESSPAKATPEGTPTQNYTGTLQISPAKAKVGEVVEVTGGGYPAGATVDLVWHTVQGRYELDGGTEFVGQRFDELSQVLASVKADQSGNIDTKVETPLDYGGPHDLRGRVDGQEVSQASLTISPTFSITPAQGPVGTPVELRIVGVDWRTNINTWHVLYDNHYLGFMSAVQTKGVAVAHIRAAGPVGDHPISMWHNSFNPIPYLNWQQGPYKDVPGAEFNFQVTADPGPTAAYVEDFSATDNPWPATAEGPGQLALSVDRGIVGQATTLKGSDLPANADLALRWWTMVGNRVSATGFSEEPRDLGSVRTGADGTFSQEMKIPDDLGGQHRIEVVSGDKVLAAAGLVIEPSVVSVSPTHVKAGDQIQIHLKGLGWTTYDNTYAITYDNSYIGYVCGFSTNGDVQFTVTATGGTGTHLIDLYPTIYKGKDPQPRVYSVPQLTYADDHPQRTTPAIRLSVEIGE